MLNSAWNRNASLPLELLERGVRSVLARDGIGQHFAREDGGANGASTVGFTAAGAPPVINRPMEGRVGYCAVTSDAGDCTRGDKGSFRMGGGQLDVSACIDACLHCARCAWVSISYKHQDCSWFTHCPATGQLPLEFNGHTYTTIAVRGVHNRTIGMRR